MLNITELEKLKNNLRDSLNSEFDSLADSPEILRKLVYFCAKVVSVAKSINSNNYSEQEITKCHTALEDALACVTAILNPKKPNAMNPANEFYTFLIEPASWFKNDGKELIEKIQSKLESIKLQLDEVRTSRQADSTASATDISSEDDERGIKRSRTSASKKPLV